MSMFSTPTAPIPQGWRAKEAAAMAKREAKVVSPEVREQRAALLAKMDEGREAAREEERKAKTRPLEAFRAAATYIPDALLTDLAQFLSRMNVREMADVAGETMNARARERIAGGPMVPETLAAPAVAEVPAKAAGEPVRRRGRPPGTRAA